MNSCAHQLVFVHHSGCAGIGVCKALPEDSGAFLSTGIDINGGIFGF